MFDLNSILTGVGVCANGCGCVYFSEWLCKLSAGGINIKSDLSVPCCLRPHTDLQSHLVTMCPVTSCAGSSWPGQAAPAPGYLTLLTTHTTTRTHAPQLRAGLM